MGEVALAVIAGALLWPSVLLAQAAVAPIPGISATVAQDDRAFLQNITAAGTAGQEVAAARVATLDPAPAPKESRPREDARTSVVEQPKTAATPTATKPRTIAEVTPAKAPVVIAKAPKPDKTRNKPELRLASRKASPAVAKLDAVASAPAPRKPQKVAAQPFIVPAAPVEVRRAEPVVRHDDDDEEDVDEDDERPVSRTPKPQLRGTGLFDRIFQDND